jgi:hypothetical protein
VSRASWTGWTAATLAVLLLATGCGSAEEGSVRTVARDFYAGLDQHDAAASCRLLASTTRQELEKSSGTSCAQGLLEEDIPPTGVPISVRVFGTMAQVKYPEEVAFLARFQDGWKVMAAGCRKEGPGPYDCAVQGG